MWVTISQVLTGICGKIKDITEKVYTGDILLDTAQFALALVQHNNKWYNDDQFQYQKQSH